MEQKFQWIGAKVKRNEDPTFLTGRGNYIDDIRMPGLLHAAILRSPHAHACIINIDAEKALAHPGVYAILTGKEAAEMSNPFLTFVPAPIKGYCMAVEKARYVGEPVVALVATDRYTAEDALELIEVEYEPLPVVVDAEKAMEDGASLLHGQVGSNISWHDTFLYGDVDKAFQEAEEIVKERFKFHRYSSTPMENYGCIASYNPFLEALTVWSNLQVPGLFHAILADSLNIPGHKLRHIVPDIGGGFGNKAFVYPYIVLTGLLSIKAGRPVKWIEDRKEHLMASLHHADRTADVEIAAKKDGTVLGIKFRIIDNTGAYTRAPEPNNIIRPFQTLVGCYKVQNVKVEAYAVMTNKCPTGANRGFGLQHHYFSLERIMDILAKKLGLDPAEVRSKNFIQAHEFPYITPNGSIYDSGDYPQTLRKALELVNYENFKKEQEELRKEGKFRGIGIATIVEPGAPNLALFSLVMGTAIMAGANEPATVKVDGSGNVTVILGTPSMGSGLLTAAAQVAAQEFGINPEEVHVVPEFDSSTHPWSTGTHASRFATLGTEAVAVAARRVKEKMLKIGAHLLEARPEDLVMEGGKIYVQGSPDRALGFREIGAIANFSTLYLPPDVEPGLEVSYIYQSPQANLPDEKRRFNTAVTYANSAHIAVVDVDKETGQIKIVRYVVVSDAGTMINPMIVDGQIHGGVVHGIGGALYEHYVYDDTGQILTSTFLDYLPPKATEAPFIEVEHLVSPSPFTSIGAKGMGEGGSVPVPAVIASAVENALAPWDVKITESYLHPEKVWKLIQS